MILTENMILTKKKFKQAGHNSFNHSILNTTMEPRQNFMQLHYFPLSVGFI